MHWLTLFAQAAPIQGDGVVGVKNITDANGFAIAATGMVIVFCALILITLFIASLPKILAVVGPFLPDSRHATHAPKSPADSPPKEVVAAIGFVLHTEMQALQD